MDWLKEQWDGDDEEECERLRERYGIEIVRFFKKLARCDKLPPSLFRILLNTFSSAEGVARDLRTSPW